MSEHTTNHLNTLAKNILNVLQSFMKQVMDALNVLKRLPDLIREIRVDMNDGFSNLIQAQAEMEIYVRMAQMKSKKSLIISENEAIKDLEKQLEEDFNEIDRRYSKLNNELNETCKRRILEIDQHLLEIPKKFPQDLYSSFSKEIIPLFENLLNDSNIAYEQRLTAIKIATDKASTTVNSFFKVRNNFFEQIDKFEIPEVVDDTKTYYIPLWVAEVNKNNKELVKKVFLPGKMCIKKNNGLNETPEFKPVSGLEILNFIEDSQEIKSRILNSFKWESNAKHKTEIEDNFKSYFEKIHGDKYSRAKKAASKAIIESNLQTIK